MASSVSYLHKVKDVLVVDSEFTPEGQTEPVKYKQIHIVVEYDGEEDPIVIKKENNPGDISKFLKGADDVA